MAERTFKTDALVLRSRPLGEADRIITLLTWEHGKLSVVAKGSRRVKSRLAAGVDLFTHGRYILYRGRGMPTLTGQQVIEHFTEFRENPDLYPNGLFLSGLTDMMINADEAGNGACELLLAGWKLLAHAPDRELLCRAYELKLSGVAGYRPHLTSCLRCGAGAPACERFSPRHGGLVCRSCAAGEGGIAIEAGTVALALRLLEAPLERVGMLHPSRSQRSELSKVTKAFLEYHLDISDARYRRLQGHSDLTNRLS